MNGPLLIAGGGELSLTWQAESRGSNWKDIDYRCVAEAPSPESRERFLEGLALALGLPVPPERRDSPVTRVVILYRAGHDETRHLMLGLPGEPIEIAVSQTESTSAELHSFTCNHASDAAGALKALADALRGTPRVPKEPDPVELLPIDSVPKALSDFVLPPDATLSEDGQRVQAELRGMGEVSVKLVSPGGTDDLDLVLLAAEAGQLAWGGRVSLARLLADGPAIPAIARVLWAFLREAKARAGRKKGTAEHEALVWAVAALSNADLNALRTDPALLDRLLEPLG